MCQFYFDAVGRSSLIWLFFFFDLANLQSISSTGYSTNACKSAYTVVGPSFLRPNWEYDCVVTVYPEDTSAPTAVSVEIEGLLDSGIKFNTNQHTIAKASVPKIIKLKIGDIGKGTYYLNVRGGGGVVFSDATLLKYQSKSVSMFIQTDKALYKPGTKVQFRVLTLDPHLKPIVNNSTLEVFITDGNWNKVKKWRHIINKQGVWSSELQLSDNPVLGNWTIHASLLNHEVTKQFQVLEYILPKFEVSLNYPKFVLSSDEVIPIQISAKYTSGRAVKGEATIKIGSIYSKTVSIDGDKVFDIGLRDLFRNRFYDFAERKSNSIDVVVREHLTGRKQFAAGTIVVESEKYKFEFVKETDFFKPGLRLIIYLKVALFDGTPITNSNEMVNVICNQYTNGKSVTHAFTNESYWIHPSGLTTLTFYPLGGVTGLSISVFYKSKMKIEKNLKPAISPSNNFMEATVTSQQIQMNSEIEVEVNMTEYNPEVIYQVLSTGGVELIERVLINHEKTFTTFKFRATNSMAPKARLLVYYIRPGGEIVADFIIINVPYESPNFVIVKTNVTESEPGDGIEVKVESKPNAYIGLLGIDQSELILKKGNDIVKEDVVKELESYYNLHLYKTLKQTLSSDDVFKGVGVFFLTNFNLLCIQPSYLSTTTRRPTTTTRPTTSITRRLTTMSITRRPFLIQPSFTSGISKTIDSIKSFEYPMMINPKQLPELSVNNPEQLPRVRSNFPESWIWQHIDTDEEGKASINETVPDTITSWIISAFSVDSFHGLGLNDQPTKVRAFRPFFISLDLPYSILEGETLILPVVVFNYMDTAVRVDVTLFNLDGQFIIESDVFANKNPVKGLSKLKKVIVKPNSGERTNFTITATQIGYVSIKVRAICHLAGDAVERKLLVKAGGETQFVNKVVSIDLTNVNSFESSIPIEIPENFIPGSSHIEVSAVGNILGTSLKNLDKLIRLPSGCGEQIMVKFVPNIVLLDYLKSSSQLTAVTKQTCLKNIEVGYQQIMNYRHKGGSFSAFDKDVSGSTWLTAFVLRSLASAEDYITIESNIFDEGLEWLVSKQRQNGAFFEVGRMWDEGMRGGSGKGVALTSFCLLPFLTYNKAKYLSTVEKGLDYIVSKLNEMKGDSYTLAISSFVLHLAQHPDKSRAFHLLQSNAQTTPSFKWWKRTENQNKPNSIDVEMTAYALLTYLERGLINDSIPIVNWLMSQQNANGGFTSTQDTVVALMALSKLAEKSVNSDLNMYVTFSTDQGFTKDVHITSGNSILLQKLEVEENAEKMKIMAEGRGVAFAQVSYSYNVDHVELDPVFNITPEITHNYFKDEVDLKISISLVKSRNPDIQIRNMVVMEITLPSGYAVDEESASQLGYSDRVMRTEIEKFNTHVVLYFDKVTKNMTNLKVSIVNTHSVVWPKPVPITVYDYYDQNRRSTVFYSLPPNISCRQNPSICIVARHH